MLILVGVYLLARTLGMKWYMKREYEKQVASTQMPEQLRTLQLGVQSHGLVMAMPTSTDLMKSPQMRGMQMRAGATQSATIPWHTVSSWDETDDYLFMMFDMKGQKVAKLSRNASKNKVYPSIPSKST